ncbi:syndecan [Bacillus rossius redtenbacheri]|uniref:syndecan n=1 Tax=Bacillus rossius redtenbacheri TaxID=93214 RepID=UPI002FDE77FD
MHLRIYFLLLGTYLVVYAGAEEPQNHLSSQDDIFIDDDAALEGSGAGHEVKDDLESSGSGYGPDDEDADGGSGDIVFNTLPPKKPVAPVTEVIKESGRIADVGSAPSESPRNIVGSGVEPGRETNHHTEEDSGDGNHQESGVVVGPKTDERATSFFAQPGILAAVIGGAVVGLLCAILVVMFIVYRMRKKDEGSYALDEPKRSPTANSYTKNSNREFYA